MHLTRTLDRDEEGCLLWTAESNDGLYAVDLAWDDDHPGLQVYVTARDLRWLTVAYRSVLCPPAEVEPLSDEAQLARYEYAELDARVQSLRARRDRVPPDVRERMYWLETTHGVAWDAYDERNMARNAFVESWELALRTRNSHELFRLLCAYDPTVVMYLGA